MFPVRVVRRGVAASRVVALDKDALRVELDTTTRDEEGRPDTEGSLRRLLETALLPRFPACGAEVVTFAESGAGPTGLAGGLALAGGAPPDFTLGRKVGCYLMDAAGGVEGLKRQR